MKQSLHGHVEHRYKQWFLEIVWNDWRSLIPHAGSRGYRYAKLLYQILFFSGVHALLVVRIGNLGYRYYLWPVAYLCRKILYHVYHVDIWGETSIGHGHWWPHPLGIVYSRHAIIGCRVRVFHNVSIISSPSGIPVIEDFVTLYAGCCVVGNVRVGRGAIVGAHAVVVSDVPKYAVVVGNPARVVRSCRRNEIDSEDDKWEAEFGCGDNNNENS